MREFKIRFQMDAADGTDKEDHYLAGLLEEISENLSWSTDNARLRYERAIPGRRAVGFDSVLRLTGSDNVYTIFIWLIRLLRRAEARGWEILYGKGLPEWLSEMAHLDHAQTRKEFMLLGGEPQLSDPRSGKATVAELIGIDQPFSIYIDSDDQDRAVEIFLAANHLASVLGFGDAQRIEHHQGSIIRRARILFRSGISPEAVEEALQKAAAAATLRFDKDQAEVDVLVSDAVAKLVEAFGENDACMQLGALLILKYTVDGVPTVIGRTLNMAERAALAADPDIIKEPRKVLDALRLAVDIYRQ